MLFVILLFVGSSFAFEKIIYRKDHISNTVLLDWISNQENINEFYFYSCKFTNPTFNFCDATSFQFLEKLTITSSGLKRIENSCNTTFVTLHTINFMSNKIRSFNGEIFQHMPILKFLYLFGNKIQHIAHVDQIFAQHVYIGEFNYLSCLTLYQIININISSFQLICKKNIPMKCSYIENVICPDSGEIYSPLALLAPYFNNAAYHSFFFALFTNVMCSYRMSIYES